LALTCFGLAMHDGHGEFLEMCFVIYKATLTFFCLAICMLTIALGISRDMFRDYKYRKIYALYNFAPTRRRLANLAQIMIAQI
jgi:hypothetical protein